MASELPETNVIITKTKTTCRKWKAAMADKWGTLLRAAMAFFLAACYVSADEAVEYSGRKHSGRLQQDKDKWLFQNNQGKRLSLGELSYIRFEAKPTPAPRAPLLQALVLPTQQRISG